MDIIKKFVSFVLAVLLTVNMFAVGAAATEQVISDSDAEIAFPEETVEFEETFPEETTVPEETFGEETIPEETAAEEETWPMETVPEETVPAETVPEEADPELKIYDTVPLYFQNDYPDTMFGIGTVETSGCSITSLAMVATYMTGHEYLPDELAGYFGGRAENNMARMEYGIDKLRLPCYKAKNWHVVMESLEMGKVVILLVDEKSIFTDSQHFIVLTGITRDGKILVNDSNALNYERWDLKEKLITGFEESDLWPGFNGAWVFNKKDMPKKPFIYEEKKVFVEPRYVGVTLTMDEREMLARMVWVEARGESEAGQQAVAEVVLNRLYAGNFQNSIESIIMAQDQFNSSKFLEDAEPNQTQYEAVERALKGPYVLPMNVVYFAREPVNTMVWGWIGGHCFCAQWLPKES